MNTLWNERPDPEGIRFHSTPSHGYIVLTSKRLSQMPEVLKQPTEFYSAGSPYFEEDCEWSRVACAFPEYFTGKEQEQAQETLKTYHQDIYEDWIRQGKPTAL